MNISRPEETREVVRDQRAVFDLDGEPVFEAWFWYARAHRWFVMSYAPDLRMQVQGVVYFTPDDMPRALRAKVAAVEHAEEVQEEIRAAAELATKRR